MSVNVSFAGNTYPIPNTAGENGWAGLTDYLVALANNASTQAALKQAIRVATSTPVTVTANDFTVVTDLTVAGSVAVNLPAGVTKQVVVIVDGKGDAATNNITITGNGGQQINGAATYVLSANNAGVVLQFDGTQWRVLVASKLAGGIVNADVASNAAIAFSKLASLASGSVLMGNGSNVPAAYVIDGDVLVGPGGVSSIQPGVIVNADVNPSAAIAASKLANTPSGNLAATTVQGALNELQTDVDTRATSAALATHEAATVAHGATGAVVGTTNTQTLTNKTLDDTSNVALVGGNSRGGAMRLGTNDAGSLLLETNGVDRFQLMDTANLSIADAGLLGTGGFILPAGTIAQRPGSALNGTIRYNSDTSEYEGRAGGSWQAIGGGINERPEKNYLKAYATAAVAPGTLSTLASATANIATTAGLFYADSGSGVAALTQSSDTSLRGSTNYYTTAFSSSSAGAVFVQFPAVALEAADLGKPVSISFDVTGVTTSGDWDVVVVRYNASGTYQELIPVAGTASGSSVTPSARLPTGTAQFRGFFVPTSDSGHLYALRFRRLGGSTQIRLDSLYVGPQAQLAGAAVTDWQTWTPSVFNLGTGSGTAEGAYKQSGNEFIGEINFTKDASAGSGSSIVYFTLPPGITPVAQSGSGEVGYVVNNTDTPVIRYGVIIYSGNNVAIRIPGSALPGSSVGANSNWVLKFNFKVSTWSSNVTMAERAVEEYASNSSTTDATDSSSFAYGVDGSFTPTALTSLRAKRVRFQTPIQATDRIEIEILDNSGRWVPASQVVNYGSGGYPIRTLMYYASTLLPAETAGIGWASVSGSSTDVDVYFGRYAFVTNDNAGAQNWRSTTNKWRVRKVSGGAAVGYPVGARNVVGDTSGTAVPAGMIGERVEVTISSSLSTSTANTYVDSASTITLQPGVWRLVAQGAAYLVSASSGVTSTGLLAQVAIRTTADAMVTRTTCGSHFNGNSQVEMHPFTLEDVFSLSTATTYKLSVLCNQGNAAGGGRVEIYASGSGLSGSVVSYTRFLAIRIA